MVVGHGDRGEAADRLALGLSGVEQYQPVLRHPDRLAEIDRGLARASGDVERDERSLDDLDLAFGIADADAATPGIDRNAVGGVAVEIAVGADAVEGQAVVDAEQAVALVEGSALPAPGVLRALVVGEELQGVDRRLDHGELEIGQAKTRARLEQRLDLHVVGPVEPDHVAIEFWNVEDLAFGLLHALKDVIGAGLLVALDGRLLEPALGQLDLDHTALCILVRQRRDARDDAALGVDGVDVGNELQ
ncbi:hypothetical protein ACVWZ3_002049 [Bradyrhizobium sp. i1.3.6]